MHCWQDKIYFKLKPSYTEIQISEVVALTSESKDVSAGVKKLGVSQVANYRVLKVPPRHFPAAFLLFTLLIGRYPQRLNCMPYFDQPDPEC